MENSPKKIRLATIWLDGCSGCHMSILDMDEKLIEIAQYVDVVYSPYVDAKEFPRDVDLSYKKSFRKQRGFTKRLF